MFEQLFGSKTRVKLLSLFHNNPDRPFYVREITRKIDEQINSVRRELANLLSIGILKSAEQNNRLYYTVNTKYEFHNELKRIFARAPNKQASLKETREDDVLASQIKKLGNVGLAFLSGKFVQDSYSNIDLFIVGDVNRAKLTKFVEGMERQVGREINYTVMTEEEFSYRRNLNDRFLADVLDSKKQLIIDNLIKPKATQVAVQVTEDSE